MRLTRARSSVRSWAETFAISSFLSRQTSFLQSKFLQTKCMQIFLANTQIGLIDKFSITKTPQGNLTSSKKKLVRSGIRTHAHIGGPEGPLGTHFCHWVIVTSFCTWVWRLRPLGHPDTQKYFKATTNFFFAWYEQWNCKKSCYIGFVSITRLRHLRKIFNSPRGIFLLTNSRFRHCR